MREAKTLTVVMAALLVFAVSPTSPGLEPAPGRRAGEVTRGLSGMDMAWIPAGTFTMGSPASEIGRNNTEGPQHQVTLTSGFWMGVYPVTQAQWQAVMAGNVNGISATPSRFNGDPGREAAAGENQSRRPVENVSWREILAFANKLSIQAGLTPAYSINGETDPANWAAVGASWDAVTIVEGSTGYRLPTEAQWERATRAGTTTAFNDGTQDWNTVTADTTLGWFSVNSQNRTRQVGLKPANAWSLHDTHGNVWEWVWNWYEDYTAEPKTDPAGVSSGSYRVFRGGGWLFPAESARSAWRSGDNPSVRESFLGFRLSRP